MNQITPTDCPMPNVGYFCANPLQVTSMWCALSMGSPIISLELDSDNSSDQFKFIYRGVLIDKLRYSPCDHTMFFLDSRVYKDDVMNILSADKT